MIPHLLQIWHSTFGMERPAVIVRTPGRVNIIGEHTDYNDGWVMPGVIDRYLVVMMKRHDGANHHWIADDLRDQVIFNIHDPNTSLPRWAEYIAGVIRLYTPEIGPVQLLVSGNLPVGAGLSSSSALVCGLLMALRELTGKQDDHETIALTASRFERKITGLQGGIMDQFAIMLSRPGQVMLLDCKSTTYQFLPAEIPGCRWLLINSGVKHTLVDSDYNQREAECREALVHIRNQVQDYTSLRDVPLAMVSVFDLPDILRKRVQYVLEENERVHQMAAALEQQQPEVAGKLLSQSHEGLSHLYEVSCTELDSLAMFTKQHPDAYGGRMMGGGFGGCLLCLIRADGLERFLTDVTSFYAGQFGFEPTPIPFEFGQGIHLIETT